MLQKLRSVIYHVNDIGQAKDWYIQATGIEPYFDEPFYVGFDIHGFELGLDPDLSDIIPGNNAVAYWSVENISTVVEHFLSVGAALVQPATNVGGTTTVAIVADPFGNQIGFIEGA